ncbi:MAG: glycosyl hydrolase family protein [Ruminococcaceae bacterium]|nr:glycosyl hydrolase family protein [Oscillospiraceae bacterium]
MKKRLISLTSAVVMLLTLVVGCAGDGAADPSGGKDKANENNAQLVVAMNPIFVYDDGEAIIAYNDIKNAIKADYQNATLTTMHQTTAWSWAYKAGESWKKRDIYTLDKWTNGSGKQAKSAYSYTYNNEGTSSLASYAVQSTELTTYANTDKVPDYGLLLSVSGAEEEALTFTVQKDGMLNVAEGFITAVQSVAGVNTGFLAEDGTARSASFRMMVNGVQVFSGTLCNSTASPNGQAVTSLSYDQISDLKVQKGNVVMIAVKLNATANTDEDQSAGEYNDEDNWAIIQTEVKVPVDKKPGGGDTAGAESQALSIFDGFDSRFVIFRDLHNANLSNDMVMATNQFRNDLEFVLDAEVFLRNEQHDEVPYEIVICPADSRPESIKVYNELKNYRANNANDYIVRRVGTKVYIAAMNEISLKAAFSHFLATFCKDDEGAIPVNYNYAFQAKAIPATIAGVNIGNYAIRVEKYPTTMVYQAAEALQDWVLKNCGYVIPIRNMTDDGKHLPYEIQIGPMNGSVKVNRLYDTRFTSQTIETVGKFSVDADGFMNDKSKNYYTAKIAGKNLVINGGSSYSVNAATQLLMEAITQKNGVIPANFTLEGHYDPTTYALTGGYGLQWQENFDYSGTEEQINKEMREYWTVSTDGASGPTTIGVTASGDPIWDQQRRPGIYGENWWQWKDKNTNNGYLVQVTKKESYGYDAGRLISQNKWAFRYGIFETRLVTGTRNGACSAVWTVTSAPDNATIRNEIDLYENFGRDIVSACLHTWQPDNLGGHIQHGTGASHNAVEPVEGEHFYDTFHSIAIVWTPTLLIHLWDGVEYDRFDLTKIPSGQSSTTMKYACGVGTKSYARTNDPWDWMDAEYTAKTGKTVEDFFEIQVVDYSYIFQTSNEGKNAVTKSYFKFDRSHPSSQYYKGYLSKVDGYQNAQIPAATN